MHSWLLLAVLSGVIMGMWDVFKKLAMAKTPVFNVLSLYTLFSFLMVLFDYKNAMAIPMAMLPLIFLKAVLIYFCWLLAFVAIKYLPISVASPLRSLTPLFTVLFGTVFLGEQLTWVQRIGVLLIFVAYYIIGKGDSTEIVAFLKNKYLYLMILSTFLSALSGLIDKAALKTINTGQMQFWFLLMLALLYGLTHLYTSIKEHGKPVYQFDWHILIMSVLIVVSDRFYFTAVEMPESQLSVVMPLKFISVAVSVVVGGLLFKEENLKTKMVGVSQLLFGIVLVFMG